MEKLVEKKIKLTNKNLSKYTFIILMLAYPLAQFLVFYVYMNASNILMAFKGMRSDSSTYFAGIDNFKLLLSGADSRLFFISLKNCLIMFTITLAIGLPCNIFFSYYLYKKLPMSKIIRIIYMLPVMVSGVVMLLVFMKFVEVALPQIFRDFFNKEIPNLIRSNETAFGVQIFYSLWLGFGTSLILYSNAMSAIDYEVIEASKIDGATALKEIWYIVLPLIFPTISTFMITGVAGVFTLSGTLYLFYGLSGVPESTYLMGYYMFKIAMVGDLTAYPLASAASLLITVVTVPLTLLVRKLMDKIDPMKDI